MSLKEKLVALPSKRWFRVGLRSLLYVVLSLLLLREATTSSLVEECSGGEEPAGALSRNDYTAIVKWATFHTAMSHKVVLVTLSSGVEPDEVLSQICLQRLFTARLIKRLNKLGAAVIALDKQYGLSTCNPNGYQTKTLAAAIRESRAIVTRGLPTELIPAQYQCGRKVCLRQLPTLELPIPATNAGLLRLDADTRRAPLSWPVLQLDLKTVKDVDSLAWVTALAADSSALETHRLRRAYASREEPYSSMAKLASFSALRILCGARSQQGTNWQTCNSSERFTEINGAIVVVGDHNGETDRHPTVDGLVYGVDLQANYVAALLDQRYYRPLLSDSGNALVVVSFFFVVLIIHWKSASRLRALLWSVGLWGAIFVSSIFILAFSGYLLTVWVQGINLAAVLMIFLEHWVAEMP